MLTMLASCPAKRVAFFLALTAACATASRVSRASSPQAGVDELIAADRGFATAAANGDPVAKITSMLADDVMMPTPRGTFARSRAEAADALRAALGTERTRVEWSPVRGGISADGQQGFTFGYMTLAGPDTASIPLKYLAYWVHQPPGWRVVAYRLARRAPGPVAVSLMPPSLPDRWVSPNADAAATAVHRASLIAAERAFSDRAQVIGLGPAFAEQGSVDAVNMGGRDAASFVVGATAIGQSVGAGAPQPTSPVSWAADRAIVASSGDLGVTFGLIRPNAPPQNATGPTGFPFFTVWRRTSLDGRWRYIAE
jgi:ketosteroid isomerase-like protein